ncbi:hypothetical protein [Clostridium sp. CF012]|uniref:hypothetical protein n=1 Tax=Clostridium sp. CF012 TaxID=2843319 RepID=UPI001C0C8480|nr:hypothetical protein [Clostridium sp. CF012]MBU3143203.1 hypothetical protein [Clostridium sp. CF012]
MFKSITNGELIEMQTEEPRKSVPMEYDRYTDLTTIKNENLEPQQLEVEKEEMPYFDLDFKGENIMQAMVYSEIFAKPKSKRRKR